MVHIPHTERYINVNRHMHTQMQIPFLHFTLFYHLAYMPNILISHLAQHTHTYRYTQTHAYIQIQIPFLHIALFGSFGIHAKDIWHTTELHMHKHSDMHTHRHTCTETLAHKCKYTETHACLYRYTNTHIHTHWCACGKSKVIINWSPFLKSKLAKIVLRYDIYWNNLETSSLIVKLRAWIKVTQYCWHNCKEKISENWRNMREKTENICT